MDFRRWCLTQLSVLGNRSRVVERRGSKSHREWVAVDRGKGGTRLYKGIKITQCLITLRQECPRGRATVKIDIADDARMNSWFSVGLTCA